MGTSSGPGRKDGEDNAPSTGAASSRESDPILPTEANVESLSQMEDTAAAAAGGTTSLPGTEGAPSPDSIPPPAPQFPARTGRKGGADGLPRSAYISSSDRKRDRLAHFSFALALGMIFGLTAYSGRDWDTEEEAKAHAEDAPNGWNLGNFYKRVVARKNELLNYYNEPVFDKLLPDPIPDPEFQRPYTLVLGLEDLLVHTAWDREHGWRTAKRPGLEYFLGYLNMYYEIVVFSDQPSHLAAPILEKLITYPGYISHGLTREATRYQKGIYIKVRRYIIPYQVPLLHSPTTRTLTTLIAMSLKSSW